MRVKKYLVVGAHPDDPELMFGGCAVKLVRQGHKVKFVACCNGDAGHFNMPPEELAERRKNEAARAAAIAGIEEYEILDNHDCKIVASIENRERLTAIIRNFKPDLVISHRTCDYHADHRATATLVQDSAYLLTVPLFCPQAPVPDRNPVYMFSYDRFKKPSPFVPDIAVAIDDVLEDKLAMINCHESQFYEWLPYNQGRLGQVPAAWHERKEYLKDGWMKRDLLQTELAANLLKARYGRKSSEVEYAESFELSEYGRQPEPGELDELLPL